MATVLVALQRVASTFEPLTKPEDVGFKSSLLNDIVFAMPRIRDAVKSLLGDLNLKSAKEGDISNLWASPEKYPEVEDARFVSAMHVPHKFLKFTCPSNTVHFVCRNEHGSPLERRSGVKGQCKVNADHPQFAKY